MPHARACAAALSRRSTLHLLWLAPRAFADVPRPPALDLPPLRDGDTRLYLCRHGETEWNVQRRVQGSTDKPLNANGRAQVAWLAAVISGCK